MSNRITLVGLGPGDPALLTREAWDLISAAPEIYLRTRHHPAVAGFPANIVIHSFDDLYEKADTFEAVYARIVQQVLELGQRPQGVIYAVPGHPYMAEATGLEIARRARQAGIPFRVVEGLSFLEPTLTLLGLDPFPHTSLVDSFELVTAHVPPFPPSVPAIIAQIHSRAMASEVKLTLMANYPDQHPVQLIHAAGTSQAKVEALSLYEIDRSDEIGLLTSLYVPALGAATSFEAFQEVIAHLRAPDGCPWDREQTHDSLRPHLLEEAYEAVTALDAGDTDAMREEFGDLLLQIVLHAQIASELGEFGMADILQGIHSKIVNRHPHVFGDLTLKDVDGVLQNWEKLKAAERIANGKSEVGLLGSVPLALPALAQADQYQRRARGSVSIGRRLRACSIRCARSWMRSIPLRTIKARGRELGDLFFALVNLTRWYDLDAETILREANARFAWRFSRIEAAAREQGRLLTDLTLDEMEAFWQAAKRLPGS